MQDCFRCRFPHPVAGFVVKDITVGFSLYNLLIVNSDEFLRLGVGDTADGCICDGVIIRADFRRIRPRRHIDTILAFPLTNQVGKRTIVDNLLRAHMTPPLLVPIDADRKASRLTNGRRLA